MNQVPMAENELRPTPHAEVQSEETQSRKSGFLTLAEIKNLPVHEERFVVDGLLSAFGTSVLTGKPKIGKSQMARQITADVIAGTPFLNRETRQGDVVYFALEEKTQELADYFEKLGVTGGVFISSESNPHDPVPVLEKAMQQSPNIQLIVIDPLIEFVYAHDWSSYPEMTSAIRPIREFSRRHDVHVLAVHHANKRVSEDPRDNTLGSTGINGVFDTVMALVDRHGTRMLTAYPRYAKPMQTTQLVLNEDTLTVSVGETQEEARMRKENSVGTRITLDILSLLARTNRLSQSEICASVTGKGLTIAHFLSELVMQGAVIREGAGNRGDPYFFSLAQIPMESQNTVPEVSADDN